MVNQVGAAPSADIPYKLPKKTISVVTVVAITSIGGVILGALVLTGN